MSLRSKRTSLDENGQLVHEIEFEEGDYDHDRIRIRHMEDDDHPERMVAEGFDGEELVFRTVFEARDLSFDPISPLDKSESERLLGTSLVNDTDLEEIPQSVSTAFNTLGMAIVPKGEDWLDVGE